MHNIWRAGGDLEPSVAIPVAEPRANHLPAPFSISLACPMWLPPAAQLVGGTAFLLLAGSLDRITLALVLASFALGPLSDYPTTIIPYLES